MKISQLLTIVMCLLVLGGCSTAQPEVDIDAMVTAKVQEEISKLTPTAPAITNTPIPTSTPVPQIIETATPTASPTAIPSPIASQPVILDFKESLSFEELMKDISTAGGISELESKYIGQLLTVTYEVNLVGDIFLSIGRGPHDVHQTIGCSGLKSADYDKLPNIRIGDTATVKGRVYYLEGPLEPVVYLDPCEIVHHQPAPTDRDNSIEDNKARHSTAFYNASLEGNYSLALTEIEKSMEIRTDWEDYYHRGNLYHMQNEIELAIADYSYMISNAPRNISTYPWIIRSLVNRGVLHGNSGGYESNIADLSQAIEYDLELKNLGETPSHYESWKLYSNRCIAYAELQNPRALEDCSKAADLNPSSYTFFNLAGINVEFGNHKTAIAYYNQVISLDPDDIDALYRRGKSYFQIREYSQSINDFSAVIAVNPNADTVYYDRSRSYALLGNKEMALVDINKAISLVNNPSNRDLYQESLQLINSLSD